MTVRHEGDLTIANVSDEFATLCIDDDMVS